MSDWLAKADAGVDPDAPGAFWHIFLNLLNTIPWAAIFWWNLLFVAIGALIGWWRGRLLEGIIWAWVLGPVGWIVVLYRSRSRSGSSAAPPLPR